MSEIYVAGPEVTELAERVIREYRPELLTAEIRYVFKDKASKRNGKVVIATARKASSRDNVIYSTPGNQIDLEFIIQIGADAWMPLSPDQQKAVLHHELRHCGYKENKDGDLVPVIIPHDLEEFSDVIEAHGFYLRDVLDFATKIRNMKFDENEDGTKVEETKNEQ